MNPPLPFLLLHDKGAMEEEEEWEEVVVVEEEEREQGEFQRLHPVLLNTLEVLQLVPPIIGLEPGLSLPLPLLPPQALLPLATSLLLPLRGQKLVLLRLRSRRT